MLETANPAKLRRSMKALSDARAKRRIISLGYYDGTTSGLLAVAGAPNTYKYDMVSWDDQQDRRVYCIALLPSDAFERAIGILRELGEPKWPFWNPVWNFRDGQN